MATVNKPFDEDKKQLDINKKLQLYGIFTGFQNGKLPSNDQIDVALNSFLASKALASPSSRLSSEGKALVADVREVVQLAKNLLLSKNKGNLLQDFVWQTRQFGLDSVNTPNAPVSQDTAKQHGKDAMEGLRTLGTLLITNGQFRKLLKDATILFREIASDAAAKTAGRIRPSDEQLGQIDRPADDHTWHDTPDLSTNNLKQQAQNIYHGNPVEDVKTAANASMNASGVNDNQTDPRAVDYSSGAAAVAESLKQRVGDNVDEGTKNKVKNSRDALRNYMRTKMPEERRDQTLWRLKKMVLECQQHPDYSQAIRTLLDLAQQYGRHGKNMVKDASGTAQDARSGLSTAETDLKTLIERFANGTSTDPLWDSVSQMYTNANQYKELNDWFVAMDKFARRSLLEQGYVMEDESTNEWNRLYDHGQYLLRDKYRVHTDQILDEVKFLAEQFDNDRQNKSFGLAVRTLFEDLGNDDNGKPTFKPHLVKDLRDVILPALFEGISYLPVPRIEYTDPQLDVVIENLVLQSDNFMPNVFEINSRSHFKWGRKYETSNMSQAIEIDIKGIQMDLHNVCYYVKRKQGFTITDEGSADFYLPGEGFGINIKLATSQDSDSQHYVKVEKVNVHLTHLHVKLVKSRHKLLFNLVKPLLLLLLRPALQRAAEKAITDQINKLDSIFWQIKQEADRAKGEVAESPEEMPNIYNRYASAAQKKFLQGKQKAQDAVADKKVNVAITKEDSLFPNVALEGGISTKATEYRKLASEGNLWESPIFSIGSAARSTDIPATPEITRKSYPKSNYQSQPLQSQGGQANAFYGGSSPTQAQQPYRDSGRGQNGANYLATNTLGQQQAYNEPGRGQNYDNNNTTINPGVQQ